MVGESRIGRGLCSGVGPVVVNHWEWLGLGVEGLRLVGIYGVVV